MFSQRNANDFKSKAKTNVERKLNFAKLYFMYKDYDAALQHIYDYLKYKENSAVGHKLLAQIYEAISEGDKALKSYQKSLECDANQEDVLIQICKLLTVYPSDAETMRFWVEKAERTIPQQDAVKHLKEYVEDTERISNGNENNVLINDSTFNSRKSYYMTPLSERFTSPKRITRIHNNGSNDGTDEKLALIVKRQEELLKNVCDQQELLLKSNEAILTAIKEGNNNFLNVQLKLDKINTTLEEIYLLKNLSFTKKQQYSQEGVDISYNVGDEYNTTFSQIQNVNETSNSTNWSKPQDGKGFAVKFKNCDISEEFQKAIHGAKGFQENTVNNMQSYNDWPPVNTPEENVITEPEKPFDLRNQLSKHSNVTYGIHSNNEFFSPKDAAESIYPETLFTSATKDNNVENVGFTTSKANNSDTRPLSELFKGQNKWQCDACYVQNEASANCCLACEQPRPGFSNVSAATVPDISFKFGIPAASTPAKPVSNTPDTFTFGHSPKTSTNSFGFTFGNNPTQESTNSASKPFSFTTALKEAQQPTFHFGSSQDFSFKFGGVSNSPVNTKSPKQHQDVPNSPDEYHESPENSADDSFHFKPLIPLPPKVDVKTGEENETVEFNERAKLYRYVSGEWKERGVGDIKILRDISSNRFRLLMRRDQVLKVCLNHQISADLHLIPKGSDEGGVKSFQWSAVDHSDSTASSEVFAIRFKNSAIAEIFRKTIEESKTLINDAVINKVDTDLEIIYEKKPTSPEILQKVDQLQLPLNFYNYENAKPCVGCRGCNDFIPKLMYEVNPIEKSDAETVEADTSNLFSAALAEQGSVCTWGSSSTVPSWATDKPTPIFSTDDTNEERNEVNEGTDFKPVIPLPDLVEVKTGEEDEVVFFCQRAKLYRYDVTTKQWKERGVGEFKILKHISKQRYRLLLRRDQVLKIACNHYICKDLQFAPMPNSENAVCWYAVDYSEEVSTTENFAVKFKNKTILDEFLAKIEEAKNNISF